MQMVSVRQQNTPRGAPQAPGTVNRGLDLEETPGACGRLRADNSSHVDRRSGRRGGDLRVPRLEHAWRAIGASHTREGKAPVKYGKGLCYVRKA